MHDKTGAGGIWPPHEAFYLEAMLFCSSSALASVAEMQASLERGSLIKPESLEWQASAESVLNSIQNVTLQGAALSRYFWPARDREPHTSRAYRLRAGLRVKDDSPLRNRELRNQMEHFDEKLDDYLRHGVVGSIHPAYVGPFPGEPEVPTHVFRAYYTDQGVFEVLGDRYAMQPIVDEIAAIQDRLRVCCETGFRIPG